MKRNSLILVGSIIVIGIVAYLYFDQMSQADQVGASPSETAEMHRQEAPPSTHSGRKIIEDTSRSKALVRNDPFPGIAKNRKRIALDEDYFGPQSKEEQAWLDRNGYPTKEQIETYSIASDAALEQAAAAGDKVAMVFLDQRKFMQGDAGAEGRLLDQAAGGTTYALLGMAGYYAGSKSNSNPEKAYAYTRAIEMLGDLKMGLTRDFILRNEMNPVQKAEAEALSISVYNDVLRRRKQILGPRAIVVDPRPAYVDKPG